METQFVSLILSSSLSTNTKTQIIVILAIIEVIMSLITLIAYKVDKQKAKAGKWRTKEKTLLILPWLLGGIGGFLGIYAVRHKTQHWYFVLNNVVALIAQFSLFACLVILL